MAAEPTFFTLWLGGNDILDYASSGGTTSAGTNPPPVPPDFLVVGINPTTGAPITIPNTVDSVEVAHGFWLYDVPLNQLPGITDYYQTKAPANKSSLTSTELMDPSGITSPAVFEQAFTGVLGAMMSTGAKGVVMTIPDVTTVPIFNLVPIDLLKVPIDLSETLPETVAGALGLPTGSTFSTALNIVYAQFGFANDPATGLPIRQIFEASADNGLVIETFDANGNRIFRQIKDTDKVLADPALIANLEAGWGSLTGIVLDANNNIDLAATDLTALRPYPIPSQYIIDEDEVLALRTANAQYNSAIGAIATSMSVPVVDAYTILITAAVTGGIDVGNQFLQYDFSPNGFFSVDGVHPNSRGQGIIANAVIDAMATAYGSDIPKVDILSLPGVTLKP
ncbi:MAG: SGNH/GDSL hydrolase family protein [Bacteroidetes bacterium]|nr:SGNH/GDSL hydrolase family protein [Bacteroidota bacterium]MDA1121208.1 SGNH/GDSL hydrolase family protein [Bacteroidota bacterium]